MPPRSLRLSLVLSLALLVACLWGIVLVSADLPAGELPLNPAGSSYELNRDAGGSLWISDYGAGEIWQVEASGAYTIYPVDPVSSPSDARRHGTGDVWFADGLSNKLGRLSPDSLDLTIWTIPGTYGFYGTAIDPAGRIWVTDSPNTHVYRFTPSSGQLCTYTLPAAGSSDYVLANEQGIWLGDWVNRRILRLDPELSRYTTWRLPTDASPTGLALDGQGYLWYADYYLGEVGRLKPDLNQLTRYHLPWGGQPQMIAVSEGAIYYTEHELGAFGILDPSVAVGTTADAQRGTVETTPSCTVIEPTSTGSVTPSSGTASWSSTTYSTAHAAGGWTIYQLPGGPYPWGIAAQGPTSWLVDSGRQVVARIGLEVSLAACKVEDADGDLATPEDQEPIEGWTVYLEIDGVRQQPGLLTGGDGCAAWSELAAGHNYAIEEELPPGWSALTPTRYDFGTVPPGGSVSDTFVNYQPVEVAACKLSDADGDAETSGDQTLLEGWTFYLKIDGVRQESGRTTGVDGCATWRNLAPGHSYAVEEDLPTSWIALTPTEHDFGQLLPGDSVDHTFVNHGPVVVTACKLEDADGNPDTTGDQTPVQDWTVYLEIDGLRQEPGLSTGVDGCATWSDLEPGKNYGVEEDDPDSWTPLTATAHDFGTADPAQALSHTFVNAQSVDVSACKLEDADGDPDTTGDQDPVEDWTVYLEIDSVRQEPGVLTGSGGCATWSDLAPGHNYAVEEDLPTGWTALAPTHHDFGTISPGASANHTFVNAQTVEVSACKQSDGDGNSATAGDQDPVQGWTVYLEIDGVRQEPGLPTGTGGCATWSNLEPGPTYAVEEEQRAGWTPLTPTRHEFGTLSPGTSAAHTFINAASVDVSACKHSDADGNLETAGDRTPVEDWTLTLEIDDERQEPGVLTGADGCASWNDLAPGHTYAVEEEERAGWTPLTPTRHEFGTISPGGAESHTFVNYGPVQVTACKLEDADGKLSTTGDRTPVEGWTVYLLVDDARQEPGETTGPDGCASWSDLVPGHTYGLEEDQPDGWIPLTPTQEDFGLVGPGETRQFTFINAQERDSHKVYLPMVLR